MTDERLSEIYEKACGRMRSAASTLYENLHDDNGLPLYDKEPVLDALLEFKEWVGIEIDLIQSAQEEAKI